MATSKLTKSTDTVQVTLSSFELGTDELEQLAVGVVTALQTLHKSPFTPTALINEPEDDFGNSLTITYRYYV